MNSLRSGRSAPAGMGGPSFVTPTTIPQPSSPTSQEETLPPTPPIIAPLSSSDKSNIWLPLAPPRREKIPVKSLALISLPSSVSNASKGSEGPKKKANKKTLSGLSVWVIKGFRGKSQGAAAFQICIIFKHQTLKLDTQR